MLSYDLGADKSITNAESIQFHYGNAVIQVQLDSLSFDKPSYYMKWNVEPFKYRLIDRYPVKYEDETLRIKNLIILILILIEMDYLILISK